MVDFKAQNRYTKFVSDASFHESPMTLGLNPCNISRHLHKLGKAKGRYMKVIYKLMQQQEYEQKNALKFSKYSIISANCYRVVWAS